MTLGPLEAPYTILPRSAGQTGCWNDLLQVQARHHHGGSKLWVGDTIFQSMVSALNQRLHVAQCCTRKNAWVWEPRSQSTSGSTHYHSQWPTGRTWALVSAALGSVGLEVFLSKSVDSVQGTQQRCQGCCLGTLASLCPGTSRQEKESPFSQGQLTLLSRKRKGYCYTMQVDKCVCDPLGCLSVFPCPIAKISGQVQLPQPEKVMVSRISDSSGMRVWSLTPGKLHEISRGCTKGEENLRTVDQTGEVGRIPWVLLRPKTDCSNGASHKPPFFNFPLGVEPHQSPGGSAPRKHIEKWISTEQGVDYGRYGDVPLRCPFKSQSCPALRSH